MNVPSTFQGVSFSLSGGERHAGLVVGTEVLDIEDALAALTIPAEV